MAVACTLCGTSVARWRNMPGHYRRAHPDVLLPEAIARFGLKHSPRPRLPGRETQRALPEPGYRARPRIQRGFVGSEARYVASLPGAVEGRFVSILDDSAPSAAVKVAPSASVALVEKKAAFGGWVPWVMLAVGVAIFFALQPSVKSEARDTQLVSGYQPEGAGQ